MTLSPVNTKYMVAVLAQPPSKKQSAELLHVNRLLQTSSQICARRILGCHTAEYSVVMSSLTLLLALLSLACMVTPSPFGALHHWCCTGVHARELTSEEADIENVNPQAVTAKHGSLPSSTQQPQAQAVGSPIALAEAPMLADVNPISSSTAQAVPTPTPGVSAASKQPSVAAAAAAAAQSVLPVASAAGSTANKPFVASQALSDTPVLSDTSQARVPSAASELRTPAAASDATAATSADAGSSSGADTAVPQASAASANKPFISSKALSDALFGSSDDPASPIRSPRTAQRPTSPFAEASATAAPAATAAVSTGGSTKGGVEGVSTEQPRFSGLSSKDTSRAERIEEALMSSTSPFSRRLSSEEVKPVMARLSLDKPRGTSPVKEEDAQGSAGAAAQPGVQSQGVEGVRQGAGRENVAGASKNVESAKHAGMLKLPCLLARIIP
jgi:hypothetical protein